MPVDRRATLVWWLLPVVALTLVAFPPANAQAGIAGFNNLSGWTYNQSDTGTPVDLPNPDMVHLTGGGGQARSIFFNTPQDISQFSASFTYRATAGYPYSLQGLTFTLQNDPRGPEALGDPEYSLGYGGGTGVRIDNSAAVALNAGEYFNSAGLFFDGILGSGAQSVNPVNLLSGHPIDVTVSYDGFLLSYSLVDTVTSAVSPPRNIIVEDLASIVGGPTAYVGFTAGTANGITVDQYISDFRFTAIPEPATLTLLGAAGVFLLGRRRRIAG